jgi:hypothetical protein
MVCLNEVAKNGSNFIDDETAASLSPKEAEMAIYGSKMALVMELNALSTIWLVKICLLVLYHRLTLGALMSSACQKLTASRVAYQRQHLLVKLLFAYCTIAYVLVVCLLLGFWCQPVEQYWALPVQNSRSHEWSDRTDADECSRVRHLLQAHDLRNCVQHLVGHIFALRSHSHRD